MKTVRIFIYACASWGLLMSLCAPDINPCGIKGDGKTKKMQYDDSLKNRPATKPTTATFKLFEPGEDSKRFKPEQVGQITGYVVNVKWGGSETCNCHTKNKTDLDIHIEIAQTLNPAKGDVVICEVTRFTKTPEMSYENIKAMTGKKVTVSGYLFFDEEHKQNAINTSPQGTFLWRRTCWEIHPVYKIKTI